MKVEVEIVEIEHLRNQLNKNIKKVKELEYELSKYSEAERKKEINRLSHCLFEQYIKKVFKELGFDDDSGVSVHGYIKNIEWWRDEQIKIFLSAEISEKFKKAFLNIWHIK